MIHFRDTRTGKEVEYPEPPDILKAHEVESERLMSLGTKKGKKDAALVDESGRKRAEIARRTIAAMDRSDRWERMVEEDETSPPPSNPTPAAKPASKAGK